MGNGAGRRSPEITTLAEGTAREFMFCPSPVLADDIVRELGAAGTLRDRTQLVWAELRECGGFVEVSRGRWMLREPGGGPAAPLPFTEVADYIDRLHKDTRRRPVIKPLN